MTHTPTPWRLAEQTPRAEGQIYTHKIRTQDGDDYYSGLVAEVDLEDDAAHIVKCVNAYDALVAENKRLRSALVAIHEAGRCSDSTRAQYMAEVVNNTLKLARVEVAE